MLVLHLMSKPPDIELLGAWNGIAAIRSHRHYIARVQGQPLNIGVCVGRPSPTRLRERQVATLVRYGTVQVCGMPQTSLVSYQDSHLRERAAPACSVVHKQATPP